MKTFIKTSLLFAAINAAIIGLLMTISGLIADHCIVYGTLASIVLSIPYEAWKAGREERRIEVEGPGASFFGAIVMAAVITVICILTKTIV